MTSFTEPDEWAQLLGWLSPAHRETALKHAYFDLLVEGSTYRILLYSKAYNVLLMFPGGKRIEARFCLNVDGGLCIPGTVMAQAVTLMLEPDMFLAVANKSTNPWLPEYADFELSCEEYKRLYLRKLRNAARIAGIAVP